MKKATRLTLVGAVIGVAVIVYASLTLGSVKESVVITEEVLYGDVSTVDDMTLHLSTDMDGKHIWDIEVPLGNAEDSEVAYAYYTEYQEPEYDYENTFELRTTKNGGYTIYRSIENIQEVLENEEVYYGESFPLLAMIDITSNTVKGETYTETVLYSDYYENYPYEVSDDFRDSNGKNRWFSDDALEKIYNYFSFPVIEGDEMKVTLYYDDTQMEMIIASPDSNNTIDIWSDSVVDEVGIYYATQMRSENWETGVCTLYTDLEVYYIPYYESENDWSVEVGEIHPLLTVAEDTQLLVMEDGGDVVMMLLKEGEQSFFRTYDKEDFSLVQEIELPIIADIYGFTLMEDAVYIQGVEDTFVVLKKEDGAYSIAIEGTMEVVVAQEDAREVVVAQEDDREVVVAQEDGWWYYSSDFFYVDDMLVNVQEYRQYRGAMGDTIVTCYDAEGLVYKGRYRNSQQDEMVIGEDYGLNVMYFNDYEIN